jgi:hypothetical protein
VREELAVDEAVYDLDALIQSWRRAWDMKVMVFQ